MCDELNKRLSQMSVDPPFLAAFVATWATCACALQFDWVGVSGIPIGMILWHKKFGHIPGPTGDTLFFVSVLTLCCFCGGISLMNFPVGYATGILSLPLILIAPSSSMIRNPFMVMVFFGSQYLAHLGKLRVPMTCAIGPASALLFFISPSI